MEEVASFFRTGWQISPDCSAAISEFQANKHALRCGDKNTQVHADILVIAVVTVSLLSLHCNSANGGTQNPPVP